MCLCVCVSHPGSKGFPRSHLSTVTKAGGHSSIHQSVANEATDVWRGYEPGTPGSRTCDRFELLHTLSTLLVCFHGFSTFLPLNQLFLQLCPSPHRLCRSTSRPLGNNVQQYSFCGLMRLSVPSPFFPSWKLSLTENQCRSVDRSVFPHGYWV